MFVQLDVHAKRGKVVYSGKLATKPKCRSARKVLLFEEHQGRSLAFRATTNRRGVFHFVLRKRPRAKVWAKTTADPGRRAAICKSSHSQFVGGFAEHELPR